MTRRTLQQLNGPFRGADAVGHEVLRPADLRTGLVTRLFQGVYVPAGTTVTHAVRAEAATLALPDHAVITGRSAAAVRGTVLLGPADPVEVVVPERLRHSTIPGTRTTRSSRPIESEPWHSGRIATPRRAAYDAIRLLELPHAVATLDALLRGDQVTRHALAAFVEGRREKGVGVVREALELADPRAESVPESIVRVHLNRAGLHPTPQLPVRLVDGSWVRVDLGFDEERVAVEYDGAWHALRLQLERDRTRRNALLAAGWTVFTVTAAMLRGDPRVLVAQITALLLAAAA